MSYRITIEEITKGGQFDEEKGVVSSDMIDTVYLQEVETLNIKKIIEAVNYEDDKKGQ